MAALVEVGHNNVNDINIVTVIIIIIIKDFYLASVTIVLFTNTVW